MLQTNKKTKLERQLIAKKRKEDARDLALLIYEIYKDKRNSADVKSGQYHANHNKNAD
jgi:hypothetical protein